jgi:hypothetical protein
MHVHHEAVGGNPAILLTNMHLLALLLIAVLYPTTLVQSFLGDGRLTSTDLILVDVSPSPVVSIHFRSYLSTLGRSHLGRTFAPDSDPSRPQASQP